MAEEQSKVDRETAVRLAVLQERLNVLIKSGEVLDRESVRWRDQAQASLERLKESHLLLETRLTGIEKAVADTREQLKQLGDQIDSKVGVSTFSGAWRILIGFGAVVAIGGAVVNLLGALHLFH